MSLNGGYAMIKYNSTQEELQIAYRSKKPALFYDENQRAHWAVIEETATQSVDEETQEPITLYEYSYRLLDEASGGVVTLDDIVDANGNNRFVEGSGTPANITGITITYNKWSLSGTHLMLVLAGECVSGTTVTSNMLFVTYSLPDFIMDKIHPIWMDNTVDIKNFYFRNMYNESASLTTVQLRKENNTITMYSNLSQTLSGKISFRFQFDLLIDSE